MNEAAFFFSAAFFRFSKSLSSAWAFLYCCCFSSSSWYFWNFGSPVMRSLNTRSTVFWMAARSAPGVLSMLLRFAVSRRSWQLTNAWYFVHSLRSATQLFFLATGMKSLHSQETVAILDVVLAFPPVPPLHMEHRIDAPFGLVAFEGEHDVDRRSGLAVDQDVGEDPPRDVVVERTNLVGLSQGRDVRVVLRERMAEGEPARDRIPSGRARRASSTTSLNPARPTRSSQEPNFVDQRM